MKWLPNVLTVSRVFLTIGFLFFLTRSEALSTAIAMTLFAIASLTDYYDGYYAKKYNLVSNFGKIMDPIADKFLILAAFFVFVKIDVIAVWMFVVISARELIVTAFRFAAMGRGKVLAAERAGKIKTVFQVTSVFVILIFLMLQKSGFIDRWAGNSQDRWAFGIYVLMLFTVSLTLLSGISYLWNNRKALRY